MSKQIYLEKKKFRMRFASTSFFFLFYLFTRRISELNVKWYLSSGFSSIKSRSLSTIFSFAFDFGETKTYWQRHLCIIFEIMRYNHRDPVSSPPQTDFRQYPIVVQPEPWSRTYFWNSAILSFT